MTIKYKVQVCRKCKRLMHYMGEFTIYDKKCKDYIRSYLYLCPVCEGERAQSILNPAYTFEDFDYMVTEPDSDITPSPDW